MFHFSVKNQDWFFSWLLIYAHLQLILMKNISERAKLLAKMLKSNQWLLAHNVEFNIQPKISTLTDFFFNHSGV